MKSAAEAKELRGQLEGKENRIKSLDDELRDMKNELNIARHMNKVGSQEEQAKIVDLQAQLDQKDSVHQVKVSELGARIAQFEYEQQSISELNFQVDGLQSQMRMKDEQTQQLNLEIFEKDAELDQFKREIESLKAENERIKASQKALPQIPAPAPQPIVP